MHSELDFLLSSFLQNDFPSNLIWLSFHISVLYINLLNAVGNFQLLILTDDE